MYNIHRYNPPKKINIYISRQETPNSVCAVQSRKSRDVDALGSREVMVVMKVGIVVMVAVVVCVSVSVGVSVSVSESECECECVGE